MIPSDFSDRTSLKGSFSAFIRIVNKAGDEKPVMICGVDEAGKGSVLGPMVIAAVGGSNVEMDIAGLADSKKLSPAKREELYEQIIRSNPYTIVIHTAREIDTLRTSMTMNEIVARGHAEAVLSLGCETAYLDACDVNEERYQNHLTDLTGDTVRIIARHKADSLFPIVSAASIIAKVTRDREIEKLYSEWGNFGSGYPSDPLTIAFLETWICEKKSAPLIARESWETVKAIHARRSQSSLTDF